MTCQDKDESGRKRLRSSSVGRDVSDISKSNTPLHHWIREGKWPQEYFEQDGEMIRQLTRKRSTPSFRSEQAETSSGSVKDGKNPAVRSRRYETTLADVAINMGKPEIPPLDSCKTLCHTLLDAECPTPESSLFRDDLFETTCDIIRNRNEARVIEDIARLIVPSAETLTTYGATQFKHLIVNLNEIWSNCIPLVIGPRPQPDFSVGLKRSAFTSGQLEKLKPFISD